MLILLLVLQKNQRIRGARFARVLKKDNLGIQNSFFPCFWLSKKTKIYFFLDTCFGSTISEPEFMVWVNNYIVEYSYIRLIKEYICLDYILDHVSCKYLPLVLKTSDANFFLHLFYFKIPMIDLSNETKWNRNMNTNDSNIFK